MGVTLSVFENITKMVIDLLEGGYYHPDMLHDGRIKYDERLESSGETLFGIDRKNGIGLSVYPSWSKFWNLIDSSSARTKWKYMYRGGANESLLIHYATDIMYQEYNTLANRYLSAESRRIVESDDRLLFNFIYAAWNGAGFFKYYSGLVNNAVASGNRNADSLLSIVVNARKNSSSSLIRQTGAKIEQIVKTLSGSIEQHKNSIALILALTALGTGSYFYFRKKLI